MKIKITATDSAMAEQEVRNVVHYKYEIKSIKPLMTEFEVIVEKRCKKQGGEDEM